MKKKKKSNTCNGYHGLRQSALDEMVMLFLSALKFCRFLWHHILKSDPFVCVPMIGVELWPQRALIVPQGDSSTVH
ncbi:hypothetical protein CY34DRAFT_205416 [Suillus luteus UH-Slu-Lm8-n1]|uniref:Uncharacterized protein n=1 Tax=Suillus luteus UH-Slu-Lm8-n1 TaxID=930992 RepID=A0A0C9ZU22_9AGAM|nr:hypothetical protein CY34DRAFT_205416 [Suillus luteus UH-Slu-Lm8-n1]